MYAYVKNIKQIKWNGLLALVSLCLSIVSFLVIIELYKVKSIEREQFIQFIDKIRPELSNIRDKSQIIKEQSDC